MKIFISFVVISCVLLISSIQGLENDESNNINDLIESSNHGHETGLSPKEKRCHEPLHLPFYDHLLGSARKTKFLPSIHTRRNALDPCDKCKRTYCTLADPNCKRCNQVCNPEHVQLATRFKPEETETGLSETQERYYTVGSFGPGPKQHILARLLNIPESVQLERLIVLAKNKSKKQETVVVPHPVVIDTAHVFTTNDGKPAELPMELHTVKAGGKDDDINLLTNQLNKELDAAIDHKKNLLGESHLTPEEIDKIIDHALEQIKKKSSIGKPDKEIVGSKFPESPKSEDVNKQDELLDMDAIKKKKMKTGTDEENSAGDQQNTNLMNNPEEQPLEDESLVGIKKGYGSKGHKLHKLHHLKGKGKGKGYYRENESVEESDTPHQETVGSEGPLLEQNKAKNDMVEIEDLPESDAVLGKKKGKGHSKSHKHKGKGHLRENDEEIDDNPLHADMTNEENLGMETPADSDDSMLGTKKKFKGYGKGYKKPSFGKFKKGYYRENEDDPTLGNEYMPNYEQENQQYPAEGDYQKYDANQQNYNNEQQYPEPMTYHGNGQEYQPPQSANQYQQSYQPQQQQYAQEPQQQQQQPQMTYQQPQYQQAYQQPQSQMTYQQPQQYQPQPQAASAVQPQAAYSNVNSYKSVEPDSELSAESNLDQPQDSQPANPTENILGKPIDVPEDPKLKANWFENEYHRLRQWIEDNSPNETPKPKEDLEEKEELVDKFTKVIEKDLTDGKHLTPLEKKNLDKKIAKMVRDNLDSDDSKGAEVKSKKKLDKLEELVEEEDDENEESDHKVGSNLDNFKSRFAPKNDDIPLKKVGEFKNKLRSSMDNLKKDMAKKPLLLGAQKPALDLKHLVEDLKAVPDALKHGANKLVDMVTPPKKAPVLGLRSGMAEDPIIGKENEKNEKREEEKSSDETVGCLEDLKDKDMGEWYMEPHYDHHHDDYDHGHYDDYGHYRDADKKKHHKDPLGLDKLLHLNKNSDHERSGEDETPTLPELIKNIEENIHENLEELHLPTLRPFPAMRQNHAHHSHKNIPKIEVNGKKFIPEQQNPNGRPLPENPPNHPMTPQFQRNNFGPNQQPMEFNNGNIPPQQAQRGFDGFVGAPHSQSNMHHDPGHFGKIVPEHLHDIHLRDLTEQLSKNQNKMYFIGDGIRLPLHMQRHSDGTLHLSIDLEKLCKCKDGNCNTKSKSKVEVPKPNSIGNIVGSKSEMEEIDENGIDFGDAPVMMAAPDLEKLEENEKEVPIVKRSPKFNNYDIQPQAVDANNEKFDILSPISKATKEKLQRKIDGFNNDIKEYYETEKKLKTEEMTEEKLQGFLEKRMSLLMNILKFLHNVTIEGSDMVKELTP